MSHRWEEEPTDKLPEQPNQGIKPPGGNAPPSPSKRVDPYFRWAEITEWRGINRERGGAAGPLKDASLRIIAHAPDQDALNEVLKDSRFTVADVYRSPLHATSGSQVSRRPLFFTADVRFADLDWLRADPYDIHWELSVPRRDAETAARADRLGEFGARRDGADFRRSVKEFESVRNSRNLTGGTIPAAIAVIDFGCPFINTRFDLGPWDSCQTRVRTIWDQGADQGTDTRKPWADMSKASMGYGREINRPTMNDILKAVRSPGQPGGGVDEADAYKGIDYLIAFDDPRRRVWGSTHGAHVLDMAAGALDPLTGEADAASEANIVFVQLPSLTASDSSGASLSAQILDAVRYVLFACKDDAPVVINISYGSFAGPHDGSSMIEQALDELLTIRRNNFAIVLAAGNARDAGCHVRRTVRKNQSALFRVDVAPDDPTDTFIEFWYAHDALPKNCHVEVRTRTSERQWSRWVKPGEEVCLLETSVDEPVAMLWHAREPSALDRFKNKSLILLGLRPTRPGMGDIGPAASAGRWEIEVCLAHDKPKGLVPASSSLEIEAWIERDDPAGSDAGAQSSFFGVRIEDADNTLSSLASGAQTVVVGGFRRSDGMPLPYSSMPPQPRSLMVFAACEESPHERGILAASVRSNEAFRMNGTSVAAPVVARRIYNAMMARQASGMSPVERNEWPKILEEIIGLEHGSGNGGASPGAQAVKRVVW